MADEKTGSDELEDVYARVLAMRDDMEETADALKRRNAPDDEIRDAVSKRKAYENVLGIIRDVSDSGK